MSTFWVDTKAFAVNHINDRTLRTIGPLILWAVATVFFNLPTLLSSSVSPWRFIPYGIATLYITWFSVRWLVIQGQRRYAGLERTTQRLIWLGLTGIPNAAEDVMIARDILLAELTGGRLHVQHVSTRGGVELIRRAKDAGLRVTAEATPHHLTLTEDAVGEYRTDAKMNPPLRSALDREAVRAGLADGTLDCLATDHAPHHYDEKEQAFDDAPFGIVGLETALGVLLTHVVNEGVLSLPQAIERMTIGPAKAFGLDAGTLRRGAAADIAIFDPSSQWTVDPKRFRSRSRNTPYAGWPLVGRALVTIVGGAIVWDTRS